MEETSIQLCFQSRSPNLGVLHKEFGLVFHSHKKPGGPAEGVALRWGSLSLSTSPLNWWNGPRQSGFHPHSSDWFLCLLKVWQMLPSLSGSNINYQSQSLSGEIINSETWICLSCQASNYQNSCYLTLPASSRSLFPVAHMETFNITEGRLCEPPHLCVQQRGNE